MDTKQQILAALIEMFNQWEDLLTSLSQTRITAHDLPDGQSIKDVVAHLYAWQQVSIARFEAARFNRTPQFPPAPPQFDLDTENDVDGINSWFYATHKDELWLDVYRLWRGGFLRFLTLAEAIPEAELLDTQRYPWTRGYSLADGLKGSHEHHAEHLAAVEAWVQQSESADSDKATGRPPVK